ncbi:type IVB secretion system protein IcmH/DotU [Brucella oryzae]|nr:type IVB secretion system protein IcmH/DotU [Brucella oryzae]
MNIAAQNRQSSEVMQHDPVARKIQSRPVYFCFDPDTHPALVGHAASLINFAISLKSTKRIHDLGRLHRLAMRMLSHYRQTLGKLQVKDHDITVAHYILCATIDDAVLSQSWRVRAGWAEYGLAAYFHRDVNSGDRFFEILNKALAAQPLNKPLLLLFYYCLALCFEGRLRLHGHQAQEKKRILDRLYQLLATDYGSRLPIVGLSAEQLPACPRRKRLPVLPVLLSVLIGANVLSSVAFYMSILPAQRKAAEQLHALTRYQLSVRSPADEHPDPEPAPVQTAMAAPQLDEILATEINGRDIALFKPAGGTPFIRILKNPLFASASDKIAPNAIDLIKRIAEAVALTGADVTVVGYTDGQPIRSRRFPSNQVLSQARAQAIAGLLQPAMPDIVIRAIGKGAADPVADNATPEGRALNRRVEIYLTPKRQKLVINRNDL